MFLVVTRKPTLWSVLRYFHLQIQITVSVKLTVFVYGIPVPRRFLLQVVAT